MKAAKKDGEDFGRSGRSNEDVLQGHVGWRTETRIGDMNRRTCRCFVVWDRWVECCELLEMVGFLAKAWVEHGLEGWSEFGSQGQSVDQVVEVTVLEI